MKKRKAKMFDAGDSGWWLETPFDQRFIDDLKGELPRYSRRWDAYRKLWWISEDYETEALLLAQRYYDVETPSALREDNNGSAWDVLWLRPGAPQMVVQAAYRALALTHHPDIGGNVQIMKQINLAYEELTQ